jgi:perosamine synthetase
MTRPDETMITKDVADTAIDARDSLIADVLSLLQDVIGDGPVALHEPVIETDDEQSVAAVIKSGFVSSVGESIQNFEADLCKITGAKRAVAVVNGTAALHLALHCIGVQKDDEVLMPALTFAASGHAVMMAGATPHFIDSCPVSLGVDTDALSAYLSDIAILQDGHCFNRMTGKRIKALMPVHVFGHIGNMVALQKLAKDHHLTLIEDAAEALGSTKHGTHAGLFGRCGALSFNGNKIITTGGGGAIITNDDALADRLEHVSRTSKHAHPYRYVHDQLGFNYRMPALNAALGLSQLKKLPEFLHQKEILADRYRKNCKKRNHFSFFECPEGSQSNNWLNAIKLASPDLKLRDLILEATNAAGYGCRPIWDLLCDLPHFKTCSSMPLQNARLLVESLINVPSGAGILRGNQS